MFPPNVNILALIPQSLRTKALDATVDVILRRADELLDEQVLAPAGQLSSDGTFGLAFEGALQTAADRFVLEYLEEDEDLVEAISEDEDFFKNSEVQEALLRVLSEPIRYLESEDDKDGEAIVSQSFETLFPRRRNRKRVRRAVHFLLKCIVSEVSRLPALAAAYEALVEHHRRSFALEKVYHNLPRPDYQRFVGRKKEQAELHQLLSPQSRHFVITIDGIGGIGKSALALEVAHQHRQGYASLPQQERFDALIWATAKQSILTSQGIQRYKHTFRALDDIYSTIASALQREDITRARREEQEQIVAQALCQQRTLLIIDNLETVDDTRIMSFIRNVPRPTKVIVTTRHRLNIAYPMRLVGMSQEEALELISNEANLKNITLTSPQAIRLVKRTGGVPLALVWSIAQMSIKNDVEATLSRLSHPSSDIAQFCFQGAIELIRHSPAHHLLMALSLFATDASRDALGYVTKLAILDRDEGLEELERLSLVNKEADRFALLPLTKSYISSELENHIALKLKIHSKFDIWFLDFSYKYYEFLGDLDLEMFITERQNIQKYLEICVADGKYKTAIKIFLGFCNGLYHTGLVNEGVEAAQQGLKLARKYDEIHSTILFLDRLGIMSAWRDDYSNAKKYLVEAEALSRANQNVMLFDILDHLGSYFIRQERYVETEKYYKQAHELAIESQNPAWIARSFWLLGTLDYKLENFAKARVSLQYSLQLSKKYEFKRLNCWIKNYLGFTLLKEGNYSEAEQCLTESLSVAIGFNDKRRIARIKEAQGELELKRGHTEKASELLKESYHRFQALKMYRDTEKIQALLAQIAAQSEQP